MVNHISTFEIVKENLLIWFCPAFCLYIQRKIYCRKDKFVLFMAVGAWEKEL